MKDTKQQDDVDSVIDALAGAELKRRKALVDRILKTRQRVMPLPGDVTLKSLIEEGRR